jgi:probable HAF family extracellular repeat protein
MTDLGTLGGVDSRPVGINDRGQIAGSSTLRVGDSTRHAFLWQNGKMTDLGAPGGRSTTCYANAINSNGQVVGFCSLYKAMLWQNDEQAQVSHLDLGRWIRRRPEPERGEPARRGWGALHDWVVSLAAWRQAHDMQGGEVNASTPIVEENLENVGAGVMGRNMFGPVGGGDWGDGQWKGWWGDDPPFHHDVFILTNHLREPVEMAGGTTYHFVTDGIESALEQAREAAGGKDVMLLGGAQVINQYLAAGLLDELELHIVPMLLGGGARLFDNLGGAEIELEQVRAVEAPGVTHLKYRVKT